MWILYDLMTSKEACFEQFRDCFPERDSPLDVKVGDKYREQPLDLVLPQQEQTK